MKMLLGVTAVAAVFASGLLLDRAPTPDRGQQAKIGADEHARTIDAMKPPKRARPLIAVLGHNAGTETTDFLIPYGVLAESGAADVVAVAPHAGSIRLKPALAVDPQATIAAFDARHAAGADYVVVAAMHPRDDERILAWLLEQSNKGAIIVGICSGVRTLAAAGLLEGRQATSYWYDAEDLVELSPTTRWRRDRRYVVDGNIVTTTGISASMPISLAMVEAIAGKAHARALADQLGVVDWSEAHDGAAFGFEGRMIGSALDNKLGFWRHLTVGVPVAAGVNEIALGFTADAWSRTFATDVVSVARRAGAIVSRHGLRIHPDRASDAGDVDTMLPPLRIRHPGLALPESLAAIEGRYGPSTKDFVATQLEHPSPGG